MSWVTAFTIFLECRKLQWYHCWLFAWRLFILALTSAPEGLEGIGFPSKGPLALLGISTLSLLIFVFPERHVSNIKR